jgi:hypothetical protein
MDALQRLVEIEAIKQLKARYFRYVDTFNLEGWLTVFTDDFVGRYEKGVGTPEKTWQVDGKKGITEYWTMNKSRVQSVHHGHMAEIEILSDTEAKAIWAMEDIVEFTDALMHGYGHYHEKYVKVDGAWLIKELHLTRLRVQQTYLGKVAPD